MRDATVSPEEIIDRVESLDVAFGEGTSTSAYADLGASVNLNAVAIGIGLDDVVYDPETFPGIVYEPEAYDSTVAVVFGNGTLFVDSAASVGVDEVVDEITAQLAELGLIPGPDPGREFSLTPTEVPVPPEYGDTAESGSAADDTDVCAECGHSLSGEENFCPECGTDLAAD